MQCSTRNDSIIDLFFSNVTDSYTVKPKSPLGNSDHNMLHCIPHYKPKYKAIKPSVINVNKWDDTTIDNLRGCFDCTIWDTLFDENEDLDWNTNVITEYINFCVESHVISKEVKCFSNNKPWITSELKDLINEKKRAVASKDKCELRKIQNKLMSAIKDAKSRYKDKVEKLFDTNDTRNAWKGLKTLSGFNLKKSHLPDVEDNQVFANELNDFYARFDVHNFEVERDELVQTLKQNSDEKIIIDVNDVNKTLSKINSRKAAGPDHLSGKVLKECRLQLCSPICRLYQSSMDTHVIPVIWLTSELVPVPKMSLPTVKNDLRPIALTAIIMKCFERIVIKDVGIKKLVDDSQFAYIEGRSVEDANLTLYHRLLHHLDGYKKYARIMFIDFSSAFNTIQPHVMIKKLMDLNVNANLILWINSFLTNRLQYVRFKSCTSSVKKISTGGPQGCVLSAGLFILYTSDKLANSDNCFIVKYADDTIIVGLLDENDENCENEYRKEIDNFVEWCNDNFLNLNVKKTKEIIVDFRKNKEEISPIVINGENVEIVNEYKYLGCIVNNKLSSDDHVNRVSKKANQRMFFVRKLKKIGVNKKILSLFYKSTVESIMSFCIVNWFGSCTNIVKRKFKRIVKCAKRLGCDAVDLEDLYRIVVTKKCKLIMKEPTHPLYECFKLLKSKKRLSSLYARTCRFKNSFVPNAIRMYNKSTL